MPHYTAILLILFVFFGCQNSTQNMVTNFVETTSFGSTKDGRDVQLFTLTNNNQTQIKITNFGGIIVSIVTKDKNGILEDVVLGFDNLEDYLENPAFFGCITGRYANRIANGEFSIGNDTFSLAKNDGKNHLHGGVEAFHKKLWAAETFQNSEKVGVKLTYKSPDGEEGYPGNLDCTVIYSLTNEDALVIDYECITDKTTIVNLTNHSYFNLKDGGKTWAMGHKLKLNANQITPIDSTLIPTGAFQNVENTPFDFTAFKTLQIDIENNSDQLKIAKGYDHNFVINPSKNTLKLAAEVLEEHSGRTMEVWTTEPGIQLYSGNFLDGSVKGKDGIIYQKRSAFCLETQHFPDAPNQLNFPTTILNPNEIYKTQTIYKFGTINN